MAELKDNSHGNSMKDLKNADSKKSAGDQSQHTAYIGEKLSGKRLREKMPDANFKVKVKKKLPLAVDIIAGILMLVLVLAVIVGSYMLFRYYSNDYDGVDVTYTLVIEASEELNRFNAMKGEALFMDKQDSTIYFGKVESVETVASENNDAKGKVLLTVSANVRYRRGEGYSIEENRLAVGSSLKLRCVEKTVNATVIELVPSGK